MQSQISAIRIANDNSKDDKEYNSENDLTFTKHITIFMQI